MTYPLSAGAANPAPRGRVLEDAPPVLVWLELALAARNILAAQLRDGLQDEAARFIVARIDAALGVEEGR